MYKNKVCVFYWCLFGRCVINGLEQNIKTKLRQTFLKKIFSNLMSRFSIIIQIIAKNRLGLVLISRDGRVIAKIHIFFWLVSNLAQRAQSSENKLLHKCFTIFIFLCNEIKNIKLFSYFETSYSFSTFKQNIKCMNNIVRKGLPASPFLRHPPLDLACPLPF